MKSFLLSLLLLLPLSACGADSWCMKHTDQRSRYLINQECLKYEGKACDSEASYMSKYTACSSGDKRPPITEEWLHDQ